MVNIVCIVASQIIYLVEKYLIIYILIFENITCTHAYSWLFIWLIFGIFKTLYALYYRNKKYLKFENIFFMH